MRCISSSLGTADLCQDLPFHRFFYTWGCLASELKIHKANQFILSFPYGSQKEQDIPLYCSTVGSLPSFLFFSLVFSFPALPEWDVFLKGVIPLFPEQDSLFHGRGQVQLRGVRTFRDKGSVRAILMEWESWILKGWEPSQLRNFQGRFMGFMPVGLRWM